MCDLGAAAASRIARPNVQPMFWSSITQVIEHVPVPHRNCVGAFPLRHTFRSVCRQVIDPNIRCHSAAVSLPCSHVSRMRGVCEEFSVCADSGIRAVWRWEFCGESAIGRDRINLRRTGIRSHSLCTEQEAPIVHPVSWNFTSWVICHALGNSAFDRCDVDVAVAFVVSQERNRLSIRRESCKCFDTWRISDGLSNSAVLVDAPKPVCIGEDDSILADVWVPQHRGIGRYVLGRLRRSDCDGADDWDYKDHSENPSKNFLEKSVLVHQ